MPALHAAHTSNNGAAIHVENLGKHYRIGHRRERYSTLRDRLTDSLALPRKLIRAGIGGSDRPHSNADRGIWALKDVSFQIKPGEVVGVIGRNGAGKSTLLKILSRITEPTEGAADLLGRVGSLLEVGTGFHPELTGRENIYLNGAILGMSRARIAGKFDEIVGFAEVSEFIDTPVKHYSSGMYLRLAFAVAAYLEPEILLVDEVLAVGDLGFQEKCLGKMQEVSRTGRAVLFVSHNMSAIQNLCTRALLIRQGRLVVDGPTDETIRAYLSSLDAGSRQAFERNEERSGNGLVRLTSARALDASDTPSEHLVAGKAASFEFGYTNPARVNKADVLLTIFNHLGVPATHVNTRLNSGSMSDLGDEGTFVCRLPNLPLPIGQYRIAVALQLNGETADLIPNALVFQVSSSAFYKSGRIPPINYCTCMVDHEWQHEVANQQHDPA